MLVCTKLRFILLHSLDTFHIVAIIQVEVITWKPL
nr:MAG TPA: hypothetical protein [Caudoviricetes sp.]